MWYVGCSGGFTLIITSKRLENALVLGWISANPPHDSPITTPTIEWQPLDRVQPSKSPVVESKVLTSGTHLYTETKCLEIV